MITHITDKELALTTALQRMTDVLNQATKERDQLAAALEATSLREAELTAEFGDLPQAQADMLATIKRLKADAERWNAVKGLFRAMSLNIDGNHTWTLAHHGSLVGGDMNQAADRLKGTS